MAQSDITYNSTFTDNTRKVNGRIEIRNSPTADDLRQVADNAPHAPDTPVANTIYTNILSYYGGVIRAYKDIHIMPGASMENIKNCTIGLESGARLTNSEPNNTDSQKDTDGQMVLNDVNIIFIRGSSGDVWTRWPFRPYNGNTYANWAKVNGGSIVCAHTGALNNIRVGLTSLNNYRIGSADWSTAIDEVSIRNTIRGNNLELNKVNKLVVELDTTNAWLENVIHRNLNKTLKFTRFASAIINNYQPQGTGGNPHYSVQIEQYTQSGDAPRDCHVYLAGSTSRYLPESQSDISYTGVNSSHAHNQRYHYYSAGIRYYQLYLSGSPLEDFAYGYFHDNTKIESKPETASAAMRDFDTFENHTDGKITILTLDKIFHYSGGAHTVDTYADQNIRIRAPNIQFVKIDIDNASESIGTPDLSVPYIINPDNNYTAEYTGTAFGYNSTTEQIFIDDSTAANLQDLYNWIKDYWSDINRLPDNIQITKQGNWLKVDKTINLVNINQIMPTADFSGIWLSADMGEFANFTDEWINHALTNEIALRSTEQGIGIPIKSLIRDDDNNTVNVKLAIQRTDGGDNIRFLTTPVMDFLDADSEYIITAKADGYVYQKYTINTSVDTKLNIRLIKDVNIDLSEDYTAQQRNAFTPSNIDLDGASSNSSLRITVGAEIDLTAQRMKSRRIYDNILGSNEGMTFLHNTVRYPAYRFLLDRCEIDTDHVGWIKTTDPDVIARFGDPQYDIIDESKYSAPRSELQGFVIFDSLQTIGFVAEEKLEEVVDNARTGFRADLQTDFNTMKNQISEIHPRINDSITSRASQADLEATKDVIDEIAPDAEATYNQLFNETTNVHGTIQDTLWKRLKHIRSNIDPIKTETDKIPAIKSVIDTNLDTTITSRASQANLSTANTTLDAIRSELSAIDAEIEIIDGIVDTITANVTGIKSEIDDHIDADISSLHPLLERLTDRRAELMDNLTALSPGYVPFIASNNLASGIIYHNGKIIIANNTINADGNIEALQLDTDSHVITPRSAIPNLGNSSSVNSPFSANDVITCIASDDSFYYYFTDDHFYPYNPDNNSFSAAIPNLGNIRAMLVHHEHKGEPDIQLFAQIHNGEIRLLTAANDASQPHWNTGISANTGDQISLAQYNQNTVLMLHNDIIHTIDLTINAGAVSSLATRSTTKTIDADIIYELGGLVWAYRYNDNKSYALDGEYNTETQTEWLPYRLGIIQKTINGIDTIIAEKLDAQITSRLATADYYNPENHLDSQDSNLTTLTNTLSTKLTDDRLSYLDNMQYYTQTKAGYLDAAISAIPQAPTISAIIAQIERSGGRVKSIQDIITQLRFFGDADTDGTKLISAHTLSTGTAVDSGLTDQEVMTLNAISNNAAAIKTKVDDNLDAAISTVSTKAKQDTMETTLNTVNTNIAAIPSAITTAQNAITANTNSEHTTTKTKIAEVKTDTDNIITELTQDDNNGSSTIRNVADTVHDDLQLARADIATIDSNIDAVKLKTDQFLFKGTGAWRRVEANVRAIDGGPIEDISDRIERENGPLDSVKSTIDTNIDSTISSRADQTTADSIKTETDKIQSIKDETTLIKAITDLLTSTNIQTWMQTAILDQFAAGANVTRNVAHEVWKVPFFLYGLRDADNDGTPETPILAANTGTFGRELWLSAYRAVDLATKIDTIFGDVEMNIPDELTAIKSKTELLTESNLRQWIESALLDDTDGRAFKAAILEKVKEAINSTDLTAETLKDIITQAVWDHEIKTGETANSALLFLRELSDADIIQDANQVIFARRGNPDDIIIKFANRGSAGKIDWSAGRKELE